MRNYENNFRVQDKSLENQQKFNASKQEVERIVDALGKGIDEGAKETVAILRAMDFPTSSSCAGHTEEDGYCPPYIEICSKAPEGWKEDKAKQDVWRTENLKYKNMLAPLLEEFNKDRDIQSDCRLTLANMGILGGFRLEAVGTYMKREELGLKNIEDVINKIRQYQKEIAEFTIFLKQKFLENKSN